MKKIIFLLIALSFRTTLANEGGISFPSETTAPTSKLDIFGDFLFWQPSQGVDWAITTTLSGNFEGIEYHIPSFNWAPGFRVGLGFIMEDDKWNTQLSYTWFQSKASANVSGNITSPFFGSLLALYRSYQAAHVNWAINFNMFDLDLGRTLWDNKNFSLQPIIGLKGGWIRQKINSQWQNPLVSGIRFFLTANENLKNNFVGFGPKGGVKGKFLLGSLDKCRLSIFGDLEAAYMWGNWRIKDEFNGGLTAVSTNAGERNFGSFALQSILGIGLDLNLGKDQTHLTAKLGYELQDWLNQYQVFDNDTGEHNNDLILQGITADLRINF